MVTFPQLEPFRRGWSFGEYGMTEEPTWASVPVRFRHGRGSTPNVGQVLSLSFVDLYEDQVQQLRAHYAGQEGGMVAFSLPAIVWAGLTAPPVPASVSWVYQDAPVEVQKSGGLYDVTLSLLSQVAAGDGGGSVFADGFVGEVIVTLDGGRARNAINGITETITVSLVGGEAIEALNGLRETVTVTLAAGAAEDTGDGSVSVNGATFTVNVSLAAGAGTAEVAGAAFTVTVSLAAGAATAAGDPNFSSVSLLLPFNGANGSTTFTDASSNNLSITRFGNAQISTAQSRWGGSSLLLDGNGDYLLASSTTLSFGTGDFTVECWIWIISGNGFRAITSFLPNNDNNAFYVVSSSLSWYDNANRAQSSSLNNSQWYHVAVTRSGTTLRVFLDGVKSSTDYTTSANINGDSVRIGTRGAANSEWFHGYIDNLRITKGVARYTANFTPPDAAFPTS